MNFESRVFWWMDFSENTAIKLLTQLSEPKVIFPKNRMKYPRLIEKTKKGFRYRRFFQGRIHNINFSTREEAEKFSENFIREHGLAKNILINRGTHYEMLAGSKSVLIDLEDKEKVDELIWYSTSGMWVAARVHFMGTILNIPLSHYLLGRRCGRIIHRNHQSHDFRKANLSVQNS